MGHSFRSLYDKVQNPEYMGSFMTPAPDLSVISSASAAASAQSCSYCERKCSPKISVYSTLITTFGLKHNEYSGVFNNVITLDELFC